MRVGSFAALSLLFAASAAVSQVVHVPSHFFNGDSTGHSFGWSVSGAGDVNGDGFDDLIVGIPGDDINGFRSGSARVFSGATGAILYTFNGDGETSFNEFGFSVSGAGDVNGDDFDDLIVGVPGAEVNGSTSGSAHVFSGATGAILYTFPADSSGDALGCSVSGAGDVNGDGFDDLIVGARLDDNNGNNSGSARVFSGATGATLYTFNGDAAGDRFGVSVSGAGDVNGDGFDDLIVGAPLDDNNGNSSGSARVFSGATGAILYTFDGDSVNDQFGQSVSGAGDVNGDGFDDLFIGAWLDDNNGEDAGSARAFSGATGAILYTFNGDSAGDYFGNSVGGAGDVNGDGVDDLIVGAFGDQTNGFSSGSARVFSGATGAILYTFNGDSANDNFGLSVSGAGDVNGDGFDDLIVGAPFDDNNGEDSGSARVFCSISPNADADGDGLLDDWESNGIPYTDSKGAQQRYMLPNANPARKDIYIEVDGGTFPLNDQSIARVVFAFDQAPVTNPDNSTGVRLHVVKDEFDLLLPNSVVVAPRRFPENYPVIKGQRFGTQSERQGPDAAARLAAKAKAFRYCLMYDGVEFQNGVGAYSGLGRIRGADFVIDLGLQAFRDGVRDIDEVAGVFMHELGHNLGLDHGGGDPVHGKPNYVSVMNYAWVMPKPFSLRSWRLDYSREELGTLEENGLSETAGINSMLYRGVSMPFGVGPALARSMRLVKLSGRPTNFDGSSGPPSGVVDADLNFIGPGANIPGTVTASPGQPLTGHNDWAALVYAIDPNLVITARGDLDDGFPDGCPTADSIEFLSQNVPEPCFADIDGDEFIGFADLNAVISRFNTAEGDAAYDAAADIDNDGVIGFADLNEVLGRFNQPCD